MSDAAQNEWRRWWDGVGSKMYPLPWEDAEQVARNMTEIAWSNGARAQLREVKYLSSELAAAKADLAIMEKQRDEARENLRDACAEIARIEARFYDALTPQQIAERNGWDCFAKQEGGGA